MPERIRLEDMDEEIIKEYAAQIMFRIAVLLVDIKEENG